MSVYHEFYAPFAHAPGRYEWARIHSTTHGAFDCFIVIHGSTADPVTVYVASEAGERFMADRFPESETIVVPERDLSLRAEESGVARVVLGTLRSTAGPVREARMRFAAGVDAVARAVPYGGGDFPVWGSRWTCEGVDLELDALLEGYVESPSGRVEFSGDAAILTVGSYGRLWER